MAKIELCFLPEILLFCKLLIEDAVLLFAEPRTPDTIGTSLTVEAERKIIRVPAILAVKASIEFAAIHALVAALALTNDKGIYAIPGIIRRAVIAVFRVHRAKNQVTAFDVADVIAVVCILGIPYRQTELRHDTLKLCILLKKRSGEIKRPAIGKRIPFVRPPFVRVIDMDARVLAEIRDD